MLDQAWQVTSAEKESATHDIEAGRERDIASTKDQAVSSVKADRDIRTITTKGYRSLGLASTFIAGVEAQFYSVIVTVDLGNNSLLQAASGLLLVGIVFSAAGAVTSLLAARWFELLSADEVVWLEHRWAYARGETHSPVPQYIRQKYAIRNWLVAKALSLPFYMILLGALSFVIGVVVYSWANQMRPIAIACTTVAGVCLTVVLCMYLKYEAKGVLSHTNFTRTRI